MHILFLIYGIGRQQVKRSVQVTENLKVKAKQYKCIRDIDFGVNVVFEPVRYDNLVDDLLDRWRNVLNLISSNRGRFDL